MSTTPATESDPTEQERQLIDVYRKCIGTGEKDAYAGRRNGI